MQTVELNIHLDRFKLFANYTAGSNDEAPREYHRLHLYGNLRVETRIERVIIGPIRDRKELDEMFGNLGLVSGIDGKFFSEAPQKSIAGTGRLLGEEEYRKQGAHSFAIIVSDSVFEYLLRRADLALNQVKGTLNCQLSIPWRLGGHVSPAARDVELPVITYCFEYDSDSDAK